MIDELPNVHVEADIEEGKPVRPRILSAWLIHGPQGRRYSAFREAAARAAKTCPVELCVPVSAILESFLKLRDAAASDEDALAATEHMLRTLVRLRP